GQAGGGHQSTRAVLQHGERRSWRRHSRRRTSRVDSGCPWNRWRGCVTRDSGANLGQYEIRPMTNAEFSRIRQLACDSCGIDFSESKKDMIASRLDRTLRQLSLSSYEE